MTEILSVLARTTDSLAACLALWVLGYDGPTLLAVLGLSAAFNFLAQRLSWLPDTPEELSLIVGIVKTLLQGGKS